MDLETCNVWDQEKYIDDSQESNAFLGNNYLTNAHDRQVLTQKQSTKERRNLKTE